MQTTKTETKAVPFDIELHLSHLSEIGALQTQIANLNAFIEKRTIFGNGLKMKLALLEKNYGNNTKTK